MPNEATNFREAIEENLSIDLNPDQFGEWITFYPAGGGQPRRLVASIEQSAQGVREDEGEHQLEEIKVLVTGNRYHAELGGIDTPRPGDCLQRDGETDKYSWTGEVLAHDGGGWHLTFSRRKIFSKGGPARRN